MKRAVHTLFCVVVTITCFDIVVWIGDRYWRSVGERAMRDAEKAEREQSDTDRVLKDAAAAVNAYIRKNKKIPKNLSEVIKKENRMADGWNKKLSIEKSAGGVRVISAGPDGEFGTDDDMRSEPVNGVK